MSEDFSGMDAQLELKDRMPYADFLLTQMKSFERHVTNPNKRLEMQRIMYSILKGIPNSWRDKQFLEDLKGIRTVTRVSSRPSFAGHQYSIEFCRKNNIPTIRRKVEIDYFKLKEAMINLFDRLQMLIRREKIEFATGKNLDIQSIEELYIDDDEDD